MSNWTKPFQWREYNFFFRSDFFITFFFICRYYFTCLSWKARKFRFQCGTSIFWVQKKWQISFEVGLCPGPDKDRALLDNRDSCPRTNCWTRPFCSPREMGCMVVMELSWSQKVQRRPKISEINDIMLHTASNFTRIVTNNIYIRCCFSTNFGLRRTFCGLCFWVLWPLINRFY